MDINKIIRNRNEAYIAIVILICAICCLSYCNHKSNKKANNLNTLYVSVQDTLKTTLNSKGELESKIEVITTENVNAFIKLKTNDKVIKTLQDQVKYYKNKLSNGSSVTVATTTTHIDTIFVNDINDVVFTCDTPTYTTKLDDKFDGWITGKVIQSYDTCKINMDIKNDFSIVIGKEKGKTIAILTDKNPYTKINNLRIYQVNKDKSSWLKHSIFGAIVGGTLAYILIK
jgi:hypothetical protein